MGQIIFKALSVDLDGEVQFEVTASNDIFSGSLDFYGDIDEFKKFGEQLKSFPNYISHRVKYELGNGSGKWAYHLLIDAYCYDDGGHIALEFVIECNFKSPYYNMARFSILVEAATVNRLGAKLASWTPVEDEEIKLFDDVGNDD